MVNIKKPKYLGEKSNYSSSPDEFVLDKVKNPHPKSNYSIRFSCPEFTSICPITGQPDFGCLILDYIPNRFILESKSFKLFIFSFRNYGGFHEDCTIKVAKKIVEYIRPKWIRVSGFWNPRGGIPIDVFYQTGKLPKNVHIEKLKIKPYTGR